MKLRVIATLVAVLAFGVGSASAQSIGLFADAGGASCNVSVISGPATLYILAVGADALVPSGMAGAEFRVVNNAPAGTFFINTANPAANVALGDPMAAGCNIAFPGCQAGAVVNLYTVTMFPPAPVAANSIWSVDQHTVPTNPNFQCALLNKCDAPFFTAYCVAGGEAIINGSGNCNVAVEEASWSGVKSLYN